MKREGDPDGKKIKMGRAHSLVPALDVKHHVKHHQNIAPPDRAAGA